MSNRLTHDEIIMAVLDAVDTGDECTLEFNLSCLWFNERLRPAIRKICDVYSIDISEIKGEDDE